MGKAGGEKEVERRGETGKGEVCVIWLEGMDGPWFLATQLVVAHLFTFKLHSLVHMHVWWFGGAVF